MESIRVRPIAEDEGNAAKKPRLESPGNGGESGSVQPPGSKNAAAFRQGGQIDFSEVCQSPTDPLCFHDPVSVWNHSVIDDVKFVTGIEASISALDLAFELDAPDQPAVECLRVPRVRPLCSCVRFQPHVELYVGSELDSGMVRWPHPLGVPHRAAALFQSSSEEEPDETNLLANVGPPRGDLRDGEANRPIVDDPAIAQQDYDPPAEADVDFDEVSDIESWSSADPPVRQPGDWKTTMIFALHRPATSLRLDWNDYETLHTSIASELDVTIADLHHVHHVRFPPQDLYRGYIEPVIAHRAGDLAVGSPERFVLLDVEFHSVRALTLPEVVRKAHKFIHPITKEQLLHQLGLLAYCRAIPNHCLIWQNNEIVPMDRRVLQFMDGDYIRVVIPPGQEDLDHITTRCIATAYHRGVSLDELLQRHTMHLLGWYDMVVHPPYVPAHQDGQDGDDEQVLLQVAGQRPFLLPDTPEFIWQRQCHILGQDICIPPADKLESQPGPELAAEERDPFPLPPRLPMIADQHPTIQLLHDRWHGVMAANPAEDDPVLRIATWYLDFPRYTHCPAHRVVTLHSDFWHWWDVICEEWQDLIDRGWPINLYLVRPPPPATRESAQVSVHVLIVQRALENQFANVGTVLDTTSDPPRRDFAAFGPHLIHKPAIIELMQYQHKCPADLNDLQCMTWHGDFEFRGRLALRNRHGLAFLLVYNVIAPAETSVPWEAESDAESLLQLPSVRALPTTLVLNDLIPQTLAVRLIDGTGRNFLPNPIEIEFPGGPDQVRQELLRWGHQCQVFECICQQVFLCLPENLEGAPGQHYVFCHDDDTDKQGNFLHSAFCCLSDNQLLRFLYGLGYTRAVILKQFLLNSNWICIHFHHREPEAAVREECTRIKSPWPCRQTGHCSEQPFYVEEDNRVSNGPCQLCTSFDKSDLDVLFQSGLDILGTDFDILELSSSLREELQQLPIQSLTHLDQLNQFDRLLIFTDGSSFPAMRRLPPDRADELGHPDTWSFVVVAEQYTQSQPGRLTVLGWTAQPVRYTAGASAYTGITRTGSDMAERSALIAAASWRLSLNHSISTVFCTDSLQGGGQANGQLGTTTQDESFALLRGLFQALELGQIGCQSCQSARR